jgi:hypothetical protein
LGCADPVADRYAIEVNCSDRARECETAGGGSDSGNPDAAQEIATMHRFFGLRLRLVDAMLRTL